MTTQTGTHRPASPNQLAMIAKLAHRLGHDAAPVDGLTTAQASDRISALCAELRTQPAWPAPRPTVSRDSLCSAYVEARALSLIQAGHLARLRYLEYEDGHAYYAIPSESAKAFYQIDHDVTTGELRCTCKAGQNGVPCKHVRILQLSKGWAIKEAAA